MQLVTSIKSVKDDHDIIAAIEHEIRHGCHRKPAKRAALQLALDIASDRYDTDVAFRSLLNIERIANRVGKSGHVHSPLRVKMHACLTSDAIFQR
jgi:hypothetical protein